jgi:hypothetical protein
MLKVKNSNNNNKITDIRMRQTCLDMSKVLELSDKEHKIIIISFLLGYIHCMVGFIVIIPNITLVRSSSPFVPQSCQPLPATLKAITLREREKEMYI